jgi:gustatory receptor
MRADKSSASQKEFFFFAPKFSLRSSGKASQYRRVRWSRKIVIVQVLKMPSKLRNWRPFKKFFNPTDIYTAQRPLLKLSLVSGIVPYKIANGSARLQISVFGFVILILHLSLFGYCYVKTITVHESIVSYFFKTEISVLGDTLQLCIGLIGICTVFFHSLVQRHKFVMWFHLMARIDEQLKEIGIETDYQSTLKFIFMVLLVKFIFFNTYLLGSWVLFKIANIYPNYACWVVFFMPHIFISIIVVLFICLVKQMKHRFLLLNKVRMIGFSAK